MTRPGLDAPTMPATEGLIIPPSHPSWVARTQGLRGADHLAIPATAYARPPHAHRCWGQSVAYKPERNIWACPCGGVRVSTSLDVGEWVHRNTRPGAPDAGFTYPEAAAPWPTVSWWGRLRLRITGWLR